MPESKVATNSEPQRNRAVPELNKCKGVSIGEIYLTYGRLISASRMEKPSATNMIRQVSANTCKPNCSLLLPMTLRTPASLLRVAARAVDKLTKLIQAMSRISTPIRPRVYSELLLLT